MGHEWKEGDDLALDATLGRNDISVVHHAGRAPGGVQTTETDLWDLADAVPTQSVWVPPTEARVHLVVSTAAADTLLGLGAQKVAVIGLVDWDTPEVTEVVEMAGIVAVPTTQSFVIVHRLRVIENGASGPNVGTITATAQTDNTITAVIRVQQGQSTMAIYGVPSTQTLAMTTAFAGVLRTGAGAIVDVSLCTANRPDVVATFVHLGTLAVSGGGESSVVREFHPPAAFEGPVIIKLHATASIDDTDVSGGFDGYLVDK